MSTTFVTERQKDHLKAALELTGSGGFMEDAIAVAAYRPGQEGNPEQIVAVAVFECFRGGRAELHFGMVGGRVPSLEIMQGIMGVAFHPRALNLARVMARTPVENVNAICSLLKIGFQIEYRDRASLTGGRDAIVSSLDRDTILNHKAPAGPKPETSLDTGA